MTFGMPGTLVRTPASVDEESAVEVARGAFEELHSYLASSGYEGWEFDDFLAGRLVDRLCFGSLYAKRVAIQVGMRLPFNPRRLLGVPKLPSTKANGFFARGYLRYFEATGDQFWLERACELLDWLLKNPSSGYPGISWGNHFDFANRGGMFPAGIPTVVWTSHIAKTFRIAASLSGDDRYKDVDQLAAEFVFEALGEVPQAVGSVIPYAPGLDLTVHNSSLLGAVVLARAGIDSGRTEWVDRAKRAFQWSLAHQEANGAWMYGTGEKYAWADNFHTAYIIDSLIEGRELLGEMVVPNAQIERSIDYWLDTFFTADGLPGYYSDQVYPLNIQCASQAIETLANLSGQSPDCARVGTKVMLWTVANMRRRDGGYRYKINRFATNDLSSIHWGEATMLSALGTYVSAHSPGAAT